MFSNAPTTRRDFADTHSLAAEPAAALKLPGRLDTADAPDLYLLRLVGCAALATLLLALATGISL